MEGELNAVFHKGCALAFVGAKLVFVVLHAAIE